METVHTDDAPAASEGDQTVLDEALLLTNRPRAHSAFRRFGLQLVDIPFSPRPTAIIGANAFGKCVFQPIVDGISG